MENPFHKVFFIPNIIWDGYTSFPSGEEPKPAQALLASDHKAKRSQN
ncbi:MAG: hypothetical protein F6K42_30225 [Leptolyngbya sp. SIO1D8]|nr:hypothetical protein [Leptolyngbya sp. SIO1D8]